MPNCVIKGCKNRSSKDKKRDGITFHTFPDRNIDMKEKWVAMIRQSRKEPLWLPTSRSVICSAHFKDEDLYYTNKGLRRVVKNGYPKILPHVLEGLKNEDLSQSPDVMLDTLDPLDLENPTVPDLAIDLSLSQPTTSCTVQNDTSADLSVQDSDQATTLSTVQPVQQNLRIFETLERHKLRKRVLLLETRLGLYKKKIRTLNQKVRRLSERNKSLKGKLNNLKQQHHA